jgi:hypothetical protein
VQVAVRAGTPATSVPKAAVPEYRSTVEAVRIEEDEAERVRTIFRRYLELTWEGAPDSLPLETDRRVWPSSDCDSPVSAETQPVSGRFALPARRTVGLGQIPQSTR